MQAQLSYYNEFKNEVMTKWLGAFLGHSHLSVKRVSDRGGGVLLYKGLSNGLLCSWREYLSTMLEESPQEYTVRYEVGTADTVGMPPAPAAAAAPADAPDPDADEAAAETPPGGAGYPCEN